MTFDPSVLQYYSVDLVYIVIKFFHGSICYAFAMQINICDIEDYLQLACS